YYSVNREGPWTVIAKGVKNDGRYRWQVPQEIGPLAFVRLVGADEAGNMARCGTGQAGARGGRSGPPGGGVGVRRAGPAGAAPAGGSAAGNWPVTGAGVRRPSPTRKQG